MCAATAPTAPTPRRSTNTRSTRASTGSAASAATCASGAPTPSTPTGPPWTAPGLAHRPPPTDADLADGAHRVVRGGSWFYPGDHARVAYRDRFGPTDRVDDLGFRLARSFPAR